MKKNNEYLRPSAEMINIDKLCVPLCQSYSDPLNADASFEELEMNTYIW